MNLYWCETPDHDDDWFIVAPSAKEAKRMHEDAAGYDRGEAQATVVLRIPIECDSHQGQSRKSLFGADFRDSPCT